MKKPAFDRPKAVLGPQPDAIGESITRMARDIAEYVPGYRLKQQVQITPVPEDQPVHTLAGSEPVTHQVSVFLEVEGAAFDQHHRGRGGRAGAPRVERAYVGTDAGEAGADAGISAHLDIVADVRGGQADLYFCSAACLRAFFNACVDEFESRIAKARQKHSGENL